jgi:hypothetical protein
VTEMVMIAITPMPPTISAIDEITPRAQQDRRGNLSHTLRIASDVTMSKSFGLSSVSRVECA